MFVCRCSIDGNALVVCLKRLPLKNVGSTPTICIASVEFKANSLWRRLKRCWFDPNHLQPATVVLRNWAHSSGNHMQPGCHRATVLCGVNGKTRGIPAKCWSNSNQLHFVAIGGRVRHPSIISRSRFSLMWSAQTD